jgi:hypothetical protein
LFHNFIECYTGVSLFPDFIYDYGWALQVGVPPSILWAIGIASLVFGIILMNLLIPLAGIAPTEPFWKVLVLNLSTWSLFMVVRVIYQSLIGMSSISLFVIVVIVATGASAAVPAAWKIDGEKIVTYTEAILQEKLPQSVIVIGSGAIGVEFSTIWRSYGSEVTVVEMLPRLVPLEDEEVSAELAKAFARRKINTLVNHRVEALESSDAGVSFPQLIASSKVQPERPPPQCGASVVYWMA